MAAQGQTGLFDALATTRQGNAAVKKLWPESEPKAEVSGQPPAFAAGNTNQSSGADSNAAAQSTASVAPTEPETKSPENRANQALFRLGEGVDLGEMDFSAVSAVVGRVVAANKKVWNVEIDAVPTFDALSDDVKEAVAKYGKDEKPKGVLHRGRVYVVADMHVSEADVEATILHEVEGHVGVHRLYGKDINTKLNQLFLAIGGINGLSEIARKRGITSLGSYAEALGKSEFTDDVRVQIMMDEVLAHVAESPKFGDRVKVIVGAIRQWLLDHGFADLAEYGETDLLHILAQGRKQLKAVKADAGQTVLMFAGRSAETADRHALASAQRRIATGEDAEAVRQDTGWHRGADGMWRFEITDDQAQLAVGGNTAAEMLDAAALDSGAVRVADILDHPQLFAAYPHMENICGYTMVNAKFFAWGDSASGKKVGDLLRSVAAMVRRVDDPARPHQGAERG